MTLALTLLFTINLYIRVVNAQKLSHAKALRGRKDR
jgi:hypothetical protein